jgi:hypothetical protein
MIVKQIVGTPSGTPVDPTVTGSPDYITLARVVVRANTTSILGSDITDLRPATAVTVAVGGVLPAGTQAVRDAIAAPYGGLPVWRQDKVWMEVYDGTAYRAQSVPVVATLADVTNPLTGMLVILSTINMLMRYDGAAWKSAAALGGSAVGTRHSARYRQTSAQSIVNGTDTPIQFQTPDRTCTDVVASGTGNSIFTLQRSGSWTIAAGCRLVANAGGGERGLSISTDPVTVSANHLVQTSVFPGGAPGTMTISLTDYFTAGTPIDIGVFQNCGGALSMALDLPNIVRVTFTYHGQEE